MKTEVMGLYSSVSARLDSWHGYQDEGREILASLKRDGVRNVIVLSADIHMAIDFPHDVVHELLAGPIAASPHCSGIHAAARLAALQRLGRPFVCEGTNFGTLTLRPGSPPQAELTFVDERGTVRHRRGRQAWLVRSRRFRMASSERIGTILTSSRG